MVPEIPEKSLIARPQCRSCAGPDLRLIISLGRTPLANALLTTEELSRPEPTYPLDLVLCPDCTLVQITETVPPESLFREYLYFSSFSDTMLRHAREIVRRLIVSQSIDANSLAVEIASNDGYLLQYYKEAGVPVLGIEPATNVAQVAREKRGIPTLSEFFDTSLARQLAEEGQRADVIHANNVLAHVPDLNGFVAGLRLLLKSNGICSIEVPYVKDMMDGCEFDTIYHEHLCYFSLTALKRLFSRHDLVIRSVERIPIHGGSLRLFVVAGGAEQDKSVTDLLEEESNWGVGSIEFYQGFASRVEAIRTALRDLISSLKEKNQRLAAYGAAAKGCTLLNYLQIGGESLDFIVDRSTYKQGHYMPGVRLPIFAPVKLLEEMPAYVLLLTWNFASEILEQQQEYRNRGGRFIIPVPEIKIL